MSVTKSSLINDFSEMLLNMHKANPAKPGTGWIEHHFAQTGSQLAKKLADMGGRIDLGEHIEIIAGIRDKLCEQEHIKNELSSDHGRERYSVRMQAFARGYKIEVLPGISKQEDADAHKKGIDDALALPTDIGVDPLGLSGLPTRKKTMEV